jgi:hypothetical protein
MPEFKLTRVEESEYPQRVTRSTDSGTNSRTQTVTTNSTSTPAQTSSTTTNTQNDHTGFTVAFAIILRGTAGVALPGETEPPPLAP